VCVGHDHSFFGLHQIVFLPLLRSEISEILSLEMIFLRVSGENWFEDKL
jgi:hypothetical protein